MQTLQGPTHVQTGHSKASAATLVTRAQRHSARSVACHAKVVAVLYEAGEFTTPQLLSCKENELGLRQWLEDKGHEYVVVSDKDGPESEFEKEIQDADVMISTPFHPAYLTKERLEKAKNLKLAITAGIGSDHVDLHAAAEHGLTVAEATGSNNVSTAEQAVLCILSILRNYPVAHTQIINGGWNLAEVSNKAYDLENKRIGVVGGGRIGVLIMERLKGFHCSSVVYFDPKKMDKKVEQDIDASFMEFDKLLESSDVIVIQVPLSDSTKGMFNKDTIGRMKKGSFIVNCARGAIADRDAVVEALESGHLAGYAGDVWEPQPPPKDHPWRSMPHNGMTPHYAGNTIDAQRRYTDMTKQMLESWFKEEPFPDESFYIVREGKLADQYSK